MYNSDNTSMLYMKFPQFRIPNNLVIDKKYKKPQNQRGLQSQMQSVGGMMGGISQMNTEPTPPYMGASTTSTQIPGLSQMSGVGQYSSSIPQQFEEEKKFNPSPVQYPPQIQPQNVTGGSMNAPYNVQSQPQPYQAAPSAPNRAAGYPEPASNPNNFAQNNQRGSNNSSYNHTYSMNNQNYDANTGRQTPLQPPNYGTPSQDQQRSVQPTIPYGNESSQGYPPQNQPTNKMTKVDEYGPGQQTNPASYQQPAAQNYNAQPYQQTGRDSVQAVPPLNQVAQSLNTQPNIPNLQSSLNQTSSQMYAPQPQYNQPNQQQYNQNQPQYNQNQQQYNQYQGQYSQPQAQPAPTPQQPAQYGQPNQPQYYQNNQYNQAQPQYGQPVQPGQLGQPGQAVQPGQQQYQTGFPPQTAQPGPQIQPQAQPQGQPPSAQPNQNAYQSAQPSGQMTPQGVQNYPPQDNFQSQSNYAYSNQQPQSNPARLPTGDMGRPQNVQSQYGQQPMNQPMNQQMSQPMYHQQDAQQVPGQMPQIPMNVTVPMQYRMDESKGEHESESLRSLSQRLDGQRAQPTPPNQPQEMGDDNHLVAAGIEDTHEQMLNNTVFQLNSEIGN